MNPELSPRQQQIAALTAEGLTERQIATRLGIAFSTVKAHKQQLYAKLRVSSAGEMTRALGDSA